MSYVYGRSDMTFSGCSFSLGCQALSYSHYKNRNREQAEQLPDQRLISSYRYLHFNDYVRSLTGLCPNQSYLEVWFHLFGVEATNSRTNSQEHWLHKLHVSPKA
jgi:hypothetical protein